MGRTTVPARARSGILAAAAGPAGPKPVFYEPVSYEGRLQQRPLSHVALVVVHCTELPDLDTARQYAEKVVYPSGTGNCGHFYVDRDGSLFQYASLTRVCHHVAGRNRRSVGVELVNRGRYPHWYRRDYQTFQEEYTEEQYRALAGLLEALGGIFGPFFLAGHEHLDRRLVTAEDGGLVRRKMDPGPLFDWEWVLRWVRRKGLLAGFRRA